MPRSYVNTPVRVKWNLNDEQAGKDRKSVV